MTDPGGSQALHVTLAQVDLSRWGAKASLLQLVWANTLEHTPRAEAARIGIAPAAKHTGLDRRYCWRLLRELVADRVLTLWQPAAGSRAAAYAINLRPNQWRNVPWRVDAELAAARIELAVRPPLRAPAQAFVARPGAPQIELVARQGAPVSGASGAMGRAANGQLAARWGAPQVASIDARSHISRETEVSLSGDRQEEVDQVVAALVSRGAPYVRGGLLGDVIGMVNAFGAETIVSTLRFAPPHLMAPKAIQWVCDELRVAQPAPPDADWLRRRAMALEAQLVHLDDDDDQAEVLAAELQRCQTELAAMNGSNR